MSLADTLRDARQARRISINQAALETRIRQTLLEALEEGDLSVLPPRPFLRGLLRNYALYLHLDPDSALDEYDAETGHPSAKPAAAPESAQAQPPDAPPNYTFQVNPNPPSPEPTAEDYAFPPFNISSPKSNGAAQEAEPLAPETVFHVAHEPVVPPPTAPLNLSQEPPTFGQRIGSTRIPEIVAVLALGVALVALVSVGFSAQTSLSSFLPHATTPKPTTLATATIPPGSTPTGIPTLLQTLEPPTEDTGGVTFAITQTETAQALSATNVLSPTETAAIPADAQMTLQIQAVGELQAWVIVDNDQVLNGTLKNETRAWTAHERLFVQIKNIENGRLFFQGTRILPRTQAERTELDRAWFMNPFGTPVIVPPTPYPSPVAPTLPPTATATRTATATPTPTASSTATPTPTLTATATASQTATATKTLTATASATATPTLTATTSSSTLTPTLTRTPARILSPTR